MRISLHSTIAVVLLLLSAGCAGVAGPSPDEFPTASEINASTFGTHATALENTSFTLTAERIRKDRNPAPVDDDFTYMNGSYRYYVEPSNSQYLGELTGYFIGGPTVTLYSNGSYTYEYWNVDNETTLRPYSRDGNYPPFNESSEEYLWDGWFGPDDNNPLTRVAINATYEREGIETFQGTEVMRYEASGVDAIPNVTRYSNKSEYFESFSATLLIDTNGVIRHYQYEFTYVDYHTQRLVWSYTVSDIGNTAVDTPVWMANATTESWTRRQKPTPTELSVNHISRLSADEPLTRGAVRRAG